MITKDAFTIGKMVIKSVLTKLKPLTLSQSRFICDILLLFITLRGRHNFLQMSREGDRYEKTYRYQFEKTFNWMSFNSQLIKEHCSDELVIGFDPSFVLKSGKQTPGLGQFYSGCQRKYTKGLELGCLAVLDAKQHCAYHLEAIQSPSANRDRINDTSTLVDHYAQMILSRADQIRSISNTVVFDAYFTKRKFVDTVCDQAGLEMIGRMRDDADLKYLYNGKQKEGRGRPRKYDGKVNTKKIDKRRIKLVEQTDDHTLYTAIVYSVGLKRKIRIAYVEYGLKNKVLHKIYFSTDLDKDAKQILEKYKLRFQMEYLFRDSKQHMGLEHCQARSENKLNFHFNASLTAVSVAKVIARKNLRKDQRIPISISDVKTEFQNRNLIERIFSIYRIDRKLMKNKSEYRKILSFGKIAA